MESGGVNPKPKSEHMDVVRAVLEKPPLGPDGKPIEDFNIYIADFGIGFPGSELRKLVQKDGGKWGRGRDGRGRLLQQSEVIHPWLETL